MLAAFGALLWPASPASAAQLRLVKTIRTSAFAPSSPDPSGIAYRPGYNRLLISDSEVDETPHYAGFNLFTATRTGFGFGSGTLLPGNKEPSGIALNPRNGTLYTTNDDKDRISRVVPGPDGVHGTADDAVSNFSTSAFGSADPEGVEYDPATGGLFVCDGLGREIHRVNPVSGVRRSHFDLARYGARDCEGLGLDPRVPTRCSRSIGGPTRSTSSAWAVPCCASSGCPRSGRPTHWWPVSPWRPPPIPTTARSP